MSDRIETTDTDIDTNAGTFPGSQPEESGTIAGSLTAVLLGEPQASQGATAPPLKNGLAKTQLEDVIYQDFVTYRYLLDTQDTRTVELTALSNDGAQFIDDLQEQEASVDTLQYVADFLAGLESIVKRAFEQAVPTTSYEKFPQSMRPEFNSPRTTARKVLQRLYRQERHLIWPLLEAHGRNRSFLWDHVFSAFLLAGKKIHKALSGGVMANPDGYVSSEPTFSWAALDLGLDGSGGPPEHLDYPFEVFPVGSVNFGTAIVYRQRWRLLGLQPGEIARTIPLGPGQSQTLSTKIIRRRKDRRTNESSTETESATEQSDTTKDASEIINEASEAQKWNVEAEASYGGFGFGASVSAGYESSHAQNSRDTASSLSEIMNKTATKLRKKSKASVVTETERSFEEERSTTISNPNDEIAVTYYFHTLQQQYEVYTYLQEVRNVVFVAERVPSPTEVGADWVRRHDWIIAGALKDPSFRDTLNELIQDSEDGQLWEGAEQDNPYQDMAEHARARFARFEAGGLGGGAGGLSVPDIYSEPQRQLDGYLREQAERRRRNALRRLRRKRLYDHIRQNLLHYCRAIWAAEDLDQRLLRYRKEGRTVPVQWQGNLISGDGDETLTGLAPNGVTVPLLDVLDMTGPIGFSGNYAVYPLRPLDPVLIEGEIIVDDNTDPITVTLPLQEVLNQILRAPYTAEGALRDPALDLFIAEAVTLIQSREGKVEDDPSILSYERPDDATVHDYLKYRPEDAARLLQDGVVLRAPDKTLVNPILARDFGDYLHRKDATRHLLVDSNNLFVSIHVGEGSALEPFKRAHRHIDVLTAEAELDAIRLKNQRREAHIETPGGFDPDIQKVVIVGGADAGTVAGAEAAQMLEAGGDDGEAQPVLGDGGRAESPAPTPDPTPTDE